MIVKALILASFSFFGNVDAEGVFLSGYLNGVVSVAPDSIGEHEIVWTQIRLLSENAQDVSWSNFFDALFGDVTRPVFKIGIAVASYNRKARVASLYFTGTMSGFAK